MMKMTLLLVLLAGTAVGQCPAPGSVVELFGTIGKDLGISMKLTAQKDLVRGTYIYVKYEQFDVKKDTDPDGEDVYSPDFKHARKIPLLGTCVSGRLTLQESDASGKSTGSFRGSFTKALMVEGTWSTPDSKKSLPFHLQALSSKDHVSGKYRTEDELQELNVLLQDDGELQIEGTAFWVNEITGSVHTGDAGGTAKLKGDKADYVDPDPDIGCHFTMQFSNRMLTVTDDNMKCGGANVMFNGTYQRVGPPTFGAASSR
jgi:hypothetical protein